jgi:hypothetical protein
MGYLISVLRSMWCIPCVLTVFFMVGTVGAIAFIRNGWSPFYGRLPSDGPVEGFSTKDARVEFWNPVPRRVRMATIFGLGGFGLWAVGFLVALIVLNRMGA